MNEVLVANKLVKTYPLPYDDYRRQKEKVTRQVVVNSVSLSVQEGDVFGILGGHGSGKSVLLKLLSTLIKSNSGAITICGHDAHKAAGQARANLAYVAADMRPDSFMTPNQLFDNYACLYGVDPQVAQQRKEDLFHRLGIEDFAKRKLSKCPQSILPLINVAICLTHDPQIILLDDPTKTMDIIGIHRFTKFLQHLARSGKTILLASCTASLIQQACNRVGMLVDGKMLLQDSTEAILAETSLENKFMEVYQAAKGEYDYV